MNNTLLKNAEKFCEEQGLRLTETRRYVLEIVARAKKPITAYEILEKLGKKIKNPKPPIVYRATDFWQAQGFIHRIESLNAFITCAANHRHQGSQFMICDTCGTVSEAHVCDIPQAIASKASKAGFHTHHWNLELHGTCQNCRL